MVCVCVCEAAMMMESFHHIKGAVRSGSIVTGKPRSVVVNQYGEIQEEMESRHAETRQMDSSRFRREKSNQI